LERFAAKKANATGKNDDFLSLKGQKGQLEMEGITSTFVNDMIGFKCTHYSVTESNGNVDVIITKKTNNREYSFGVRTKDSSATKGKDYEAIDDILRMGASDVEFKL
jgi:hypothetical protein